mgnify:CR=1 FL=1
MRYLKCKCGKKEMWTTDGLWPCQGCEECGTTFAGHPDGHKPLEPHQWGILFNEHTGNPYKYCVHCHHIDEKSYKESNCVETEDIWKEILAFHGINKDEIVFDPPLKKDETVIEIPPDDELNEDGTIKNDSDADKFPAPKTLDEAIKILRVDPKNDEFALSKTEDEFLGELHHGFGTSMRNRWGLWGGSDLQRWFKERGIHHADDMSSIILTSTYRQVHGTDIDLEGQIKVYRDYWERVDPKVNKGEL